MVAVAVGSGDRKNAGKNILIGGALQVFEVSTLGQPFEVVKTHMAGIQPPSMLAH